MNALAADGSCALHWAVLRKHEPIVVRLMAAGGDPELKTAIWDVIEQEDAEEGTQRESSDAQSEPGEGTVTIRLIKMS